MLTHGRDGAPDRHLDRRGLADGANWENTPRAGIPDGTHSPNSLFAASFAQAGFAMEIPSPELFYELLPAHYVSRISHAAG